MSKLKFQIDVKLPAHGAAPPEKEIVFSWCPLPPTRRGLRGTCRTKFTEQISKMFDI